MNEEASPLAGKTVVVTRPKEAAGEMVTLLQEYGAIPWLMPLIRTIWVDNLDSKALHLHSLHQYQGILFSSVQGVDYFIKWLHRRWLHRLGQDSNKADENSPQIAEELKAILNEKHLIAVGPKTAERLVTYGLHHVRVPQVYLQEGMVELLSQLLPKGSFLLYPRAKEVRPYLLVALREKGYVVEDFILYETKLVEQVNPLYWQAILRGEADVVTFTSASTIKAFDRLYTSTAHAGQDKGQLPVFACIGPVTAQEAIQRGYRVDVVAEEHTALGLLKALLTYYSS